MEGRPCPLTPWLSRKAPHRLRALGQGTSHKAQGISEPQFPRLHKEASHKDVRHHLPRGPRPWPTVLCSGI